MKKLFLVIGAPGSGKTTDAQIIAQESQNISHFSTGDMLRAEVASGSALGKEIESYISQGLIVPISIAIETITKAIKSASTDVVILDGYPRSIEQMQRLEEYLLEDSSIALVSVIEVLVSYETAFNRVVGRSRGVDDGADVFKKRMQIYEEPLAEIKEFYTQKNLLVTISAEGTIEEVVAMMHEHIRTKL